MTLIKNVTLMIVEAFTWLLFKMLQGLLFLIVCTLRVLKWVLWVYFKIMRQYVKDVMFVRRSVTDQTGKKFIVYEHHSLGFYAIVFFVVLSVILVITLTNYGSTLGGH